jgi:hypothetical protein
MTTAMEHRAPTTTARAKVEQQQRRQQKQQQRQQLTRKHELRNKRNHLGGDIVDN